MTSKYKVLAGPLSESEVGPLLATAYSMLFNPNNNPEESQRAVEMLAEVQAEAFRLFCDSHNVLAAGFKDGVRECITDHLYSPHTAYGLASIYSYDECQELFSIVVRYVKPASANRVREWRTLNQLYDACILAGQAQLGKDDDNGS